MWKNVNKKFLETTGGKSFLQLGLNWYMESPDHVSNWKGLPNYWSDAKLQPSIIRDQRD